MSGAVRAWALAFAFTQAVEVPLYAWALARAGMPRARGAALGFALSALTHPAVWFGWPPLVYGRACSALALQPGDLACYALLVAWVEAFAVLTEGALLALARAPRPFALALAANAASAGLGALSRAALGVP